MKRPLYLVRQTAYTLFAFAYFLWMAAELTLVGFVLLTIGGRTDRHKAAYHRLLCRRAAFVIRHVPGTTFAYSNPTGETFERPAVIVCNHQSHLDLMGVMMLTPKLIIMTKGWVWRNPFYGLVIRYADYLPVTATEGLTARIGQMVAKGYSVVVFPEGTRSADSHVRRFHRGAFYLAEQLGLDVVPVFIRGFGRVLPKTSWHLHPGHMTLEVMGRLSRQDGNMAGYRDMTRQLHRAYVLKEEKEGT